MFLGQGPETLRSGSSAHTREAIQALEESGANVYVAQADVANESEMAQVRDRVRETMPPLRGVLHAAGCVDDVLLLQMNAQRLNRVMSPKVRGAWNLHTLTEADPLDFFVLFSSVASVLGSPGQANYAAANAFLDALAHYRRGRGLPAVSINWGPWKDRGIAMRLDRRYRERLEGQGIRSIAPDDGMQALESLLGYGSPQVTVAPIDWKQYERHTPSVRPSSLLSDWVDWEHPRAEDAVRESPILKRLNECAPNERTERMTAYIQQRVLGVTGLDSSRLPNPQHGFVDMGMDSLMLVELKNQLEAGLGHSLPATLAFEYATIDALSRHLVEAVLFPATAEKRTPTHQQQPADEEDTYREIRELGDAELEAIIEDELGKLS